MKKIQRTLGVTLGLNFCFALWPIGMGTVAAQQAGIGLIELRNLAGAANVNGSGVNLLHVEAEVDPDPNDAIVVRDYSPDATNSQLSSKTFTDIGNLGQTSTGSNGHATGVGTDIYGSTSGTAPGVGAAGSPSIKIHGALDFVNNELGFNSSSTPVAQNFDVSNHSYAFNLQPANGFDQAVAEDTLKRLDYVINNGNMTTVVGTTNDTVVLPALYVQAFNTINVGVTDGGHASGPTTLNEAGRNSIHVVVDRRLVSNATGVVSGAAAILHQTGAGTDAVKQEVIKATILAGATKDDLLDAARDPVTWTHSSTQPLDNVYGAGELNVLNNHTIQQGGEFNGGLISSTAVDADFNGWDYEDDLLANDERFYEFTVDPTETVEDFSIALTWNREVVDGNGSPLAFTALANALANLSLELFDSSNSIIESSNSNVDNLEHIFAPNLAEGTYQLRVANLSTNVATDYGLAFRGTVVSVPEPGALTLLSVAMLAGMIRRKRS